MLFNLPPGSIQVQSNNDENKSNNKTMAQVQRVQQVKRDFLTKLNFSYSSNFFSNFVSQKNIFFLRGKISKVYSGL